MDLTQPESYHPWKSPSIQSAVSCLMSWTICCIFLMILWTSSALDDRFRQQRSSNSSHRWLCSRRRKSITAWFCRVACLVVSSSARRSESANDVILACLATQHSSCDNSPRALAADTHSKNMVIATTFGLDQCTISELLVGSKFLKSLFLWAELWALVLVHQSMIWVLLGVNRLSFPMVHGPLIRREGMPAHALSPQMRKNRLGRAWGLLSGVDDISTWEIFLHQFFAV